MSLILDALRKAENERNLGKTPSLAAMPPPPTPRKPAASWKRHQRAIALAGVVAGLLGLTVAFWPEHETPVAPRGALQAEVSPVAEPSVEPEPVASAPPPSPADVAPTTPEAPAVEQRGGPQSIDEMLDTRPAEIPQVRTPVTEAARPRSATAPTPADVDQASNDAIAVDGHNPVTEPVPAETPVDSQEPSEPEPPPEIKLLSQQSAAYRSTFPSIKFEVHVYDPDPGKRWFMAGSKKYIEGSKLPEGPRVVEITEDGVIFNYRGETSLYPLKR